MIAPILDDVAQEYAGRLTIGKVNIDHNNLTAPKFGIRSIPTLLLFKDGKVVANHTGTLSKTQLKEFLDKNIWSTVGIEMKKRCIFVRLFYFVIWTMKTYPAMV